MYIPTHSENRDDGFNLLDIFRYSVTSNADLSAQSNLYQRSVLTRKIRAQIQLETNDDMGANELWLWSWGEAQIGSNQLWSTQAWRVVRKGGGVVTILELEARMIWSWSWRTRKYSLFCCLVEWVAIYIRDLNLDWPKRSKNQLVCLWLDFVFNVNCQFSYRICR